MGMGKGVLCDSAFACHATNKTGSNRPVLQPRHWHGDNCWVKYRTSRHPNKPFMQGRQEANLHLADKECHRVFIPFQVELPQLACHAYP